MANWTSGWVWPSFHRRGLQPQQHLFRRVATTLTRCQGRRYNTWRTDFLGSQWLLLIRQGHSSYGVHEPRPHTTSSVLWPLIWIIRPRLYLHSIAPPPTSIQQPWLAHAYDHPCQCFPARQRPTWHPTSLAFLAGSGPPTLFSRTTYVLSSSNTVMAMVDVSPAKAPRLQHLTETPPNWSTAPQHF